MTRPQRALLHLRPDQPRQPDRGEQLLVEIGLQDFVGRFLERAGARGAGVVDHDVDLAEGLHRLVIDALDLVGDCRHRPARRPPALRDRADRLDRLIERLAPARDDHDIGARRRETGRDGKAKALAAAGDDGSAVGEINLHASPQRLIDGYVERLGTISGEHSRRSLFEARDSHPFAQRKWAAPLMPSRPAASP